MKAGQAVMVRRDTGEKVTTPAKLGGVKSVSLSTMPWRPCLILSLGKGYWSFRYESFDASLFSK